MKSWEWTKRTISLKCAIGSMIDAGRKVSHGKDSAKLLAGCIIVPTPLSHVDK